MSGIRASGLLRLVSPRSGLPSVLSPSSVTAMSDGELERLRGLRLGGLAVAASTLALEVLDLPLQVKQLLLRRVRGSHGRRRCRVGGARHGSRGVSGRWAGGAVLVIRVQALDGILEDMHRL